MLKYEIVLPVLNEQDRLPFGVALLTDFLRKNCKEPWSVIIADNGSTDRTPQIIEELSCAWPEISGIRLESPGVGRALKKAWASSEADVIGYMDVDMSTDLDTMHQVLNYFGSGGTGFFNGSRNSQGSEVIGRKMLRNITSKSLNLIYRILLDTPIEDCMCGFKFMRRDTYQKISAVGLENDGWFFCAEILAVAHHLGIEIFEVPIKWTDSPSDRVKILKLSSNYMIQMLKLRSKLKSFKQLKSAIRDGRA